MHVHSRLPARRPALVLTLVAAVGMTVLPAGARADCTDGSPTGQQVMGALLGAAAGALIGSQIGSGTGRAIAIGAGAIAGGLFGNNFGRSLDCKDQAYHSSAAQDALEAARITYLGRSEGRISAILRAWAHSRPRSGPRSAKKRIGSKVWSARRWRRVSQPWRSARARPARI